MDVSSDNNKNNIKLGPMTRTSLRLVGANDIEFEFESDPSESYDSLNGSSSEGSVSDLSRSELQALLKANKAEVDAVAASMKTEMANWREQMRTDLKEIKNSVERQTDKIDHNFNSQQTKLDAAIQIQTAKLEKTVSDTRIDIIRWVLGIPALLFTVWKFYEAIVK